MEDYILNEIKRITQFLISLIEKLQLFSATRGKEAISNALKSEMFDKMDINIDEIIETNDCVNILIEKHGFNDEDMDTFAELLYNLSQITENEDLKSKYIENIKLIYKHLDKNATFFSFNRYRIEKNM